MKKTFVKPEMQLVELRLEERIADCNCLKDGHLECTCCEHDLEQLIGMCCPHCCTCNPEVGSESDF